jgi:hypothetical protein
MTRYTLARRLVGIWRDFDEKLSWKYRELAPALLLRSLKLYEKDVDRSELNRAEWFWRRRPRLILGEGFFGWVEVCLPAIVLFSVPLSFVRLGALAPLLGLGLSLEWIFAMCVTIMTDNARLVRWRREYEVSVDRPIRKRHSAS